MGFDTIEMNLVFFLVKVAIITTISLYTFLVFFPPNFVFSASFPCFYSWYFDMNLIFCSRSFMSSHVICIRILSTSMDLSYSASRASTTHQPLGLHLQLLEDPVHPLPLVLAGLHIQDVAVLTGVASLVTRINCISKS